MIVKRRDIDTNRLDGGLVEVLVEQLFFGVPLFRSLFAYTMDTTNTLNTYIRATQVTYVRLWLEMAFRCEIESMGVPLLTSARTMGMPYIPVTLQMDAQLYYTEMTTKAQQVFNVYLSENNLSEAHPDVQPKSYSEFQATLDQLLDEEYDDGDYDD